MMDGVKPGDWRPIQGGPFCVDSQTRIEVYDHRNEPRGEVAVSGQLEDNTLSLFLTDRKPQEEGA